MTAIRIFRYFGAAAASIAVCAGLLGCSIWPSAMTQDTFKLYVPEVVQGNFVSTEQRRALRLGMPRAQVREVLGTPLVASLFHADRWDYAFSIQRQGVPEQKFRLTVVFKGDALSDIEGDELPSEAEFVKRLTSRSKAPVVPRLEATEAQLSQFPAGRVLAPVPAATSLPATYPPLEATAR